MMHAVYRDHRFRFAVVGAVVTVLHLGLVASLTGWSVAEVDNSVAFVVATQVNFVLSYAWTWSSRRPAGAEPLIRVLHRAAVFNGSAVIAFVVNEAVFVVVHRASGAPPVLSALVATVASAVVSFVVSSRLTFAHRRPVAPQVVVGAAAGAALGAPAPAAPAGGVGR